MNTFSNDRRFRTAVCVLLGFGIFLAVPGSAGARGGEPGGADSLSWDFPVPKEGGILAFVSDLFTPDLVLETRQIRAYVTDARFRILLDRGGSMRAVDAIYLRALKISGYHTEGALFLSLMAVLEHRRVDLKIPVLTSVAIPLTFENDSLFFARVRNLPSRLYIDTPADSAGDRDKLQHFFASAYLSYVTDAPEFARTAGNLVEWGEAKFVVGGADDPRDKRSNRQGELFGRDLLVVKTLLPSDYIAIPPHGDYPARQGGGPE